MFKAIKYPTVAVEIGEGYASAVRMSGGSGKLTMDDFLTVDLPFRQSDEGNQWNAYKLDESNQEGIDEILDWIGKEKSISLVMPDMATRSFFVQLENESNNRNEMRDLILFKVQKFAPVSTEGTTLDYLRLPQSANRKRKDYLALISSKSVIHSYEKYFRQRGIQIGNVESASLATLELFARGSGTAIDNDGSFVLVRIESGHFTLAVFNDYNLVFMRTRVINNDGRAAERIIREITTLRLFVVDRLGSDPYNTALFYGPGNILEEAYERTAESGLTVAKLELEEFIQLPNELLQHQSYQGRFYASASAASRSLS